MVYLPTYLNPVYLTCRSQGIWAVCCLCPVPPSPRHFYASRHFPLPTVSSILLNIPTRYYHPIKQPRPTGALSSTPRRWSGGRIPHLKIITAFTHLTSTGSATAPGVGRSTSSATRTRMYSGALYMQSSTACSLPFRILTHGIPMSVS